ncbi:hypothetical protein [Microcoleus sp. N3A4]
MTARPVGGRAIDQNPKIIPENWFVVMNASPAFLRTEVLIDYCQLTTDY